MLDAYRDLIDELLGTPTEIRGLIQNADTVSPEARQRIAELRDRDHAVLARAQAMTREQQPYLGDLRVVVSADEDQDLAALIADLESSRGDLVSLLINLSLKDWERTGLHDTLGEIVLADEIEQHVEFDEAQRAAIRAAL